LKIGGWLNVVHRSLPCYCEPDSIPSQLTIDLTDTKITSRMRLRDITFPEGCAVAARFSNKVEIFDRTVLATINGKKQEDEDEPEQD